MKCLFCYNKTTKIRNNQVCPCKKTWVEYGFISNTFNIVIKEQYLLRGFSYNKDYEHLGNSFTSVINHNGIDYDSWMRIRFSNVIGTNCNFNIRNKTLNELESFIYKHMKTMILS